MYCLGRLCIYLGGETKLAILRQYGSLDCQAHTSFESQIRQQQSASHIVFIMIQIYIIIRIGYNYKTPKAPFQSYFFYEQHHAELQRNTILEKHTKKDPC